MNQLGTVSDFRETQRVVQLSERELEKERERERERGEITSEPVDGML